MGEQMVGQFCARKALFRPYDAHLSWWATVCCPSGTFGKKQSLTNRSPPDHDPHARRALHASHSTAVRLPLVY
jgi:hypothetical protein